MDTLITAVNRILAARWFFWVRASQFALALAIFTFAALMPPRYAAPLQQPDYVLHFMGNLALFLSASLATYGRMNMALLVVFLTCYSVMVELAQRFAPGRHVDVQDIFANIAGLCVGLIIVHVIAWLWRWLNRTYSTTRA